MMMRTFVLMTCRGSGEHAAAWLNDRRNLVASACATQQIEQCDIFDIRNEVLR